MTYRPGVVVRVPFPFVDSRESKHRPALVLSSEKFNAEHGHAVMAMITSSRHSRWPTDVPISELAEGRLPSPSMVRFKLFTLDDRLVAGVLGTMNSDDWKAVRGVLETILLG